MPTPPRPAFNRWRDVDGSPIPQQCRIQQVTVEKNFGALQSRLHRQGRVVGRGQTRLIVRFDDEDALVRIRPHVVRVLTAPCGY